MEWRDRRLLLAAKEAGAGAVLAALAEQTPPAADSRVLLSQVAAPYFERLPYRSLVLDAAFGAAEAHAIMQEVRPDLVVTGAGAQQSLEKILLTAAMERGIEAHAVVDHFWNLWQRFADPDTAARWSCLPDVIWVPSDACRRRISEEGAPPERVRVFSHPLYSAVDAPNAAARPDARARLELGLPADACVLLFVSEWSLPREGPWRWEGPERAEFAALLLALLEQAERAARATTRLFHVIVKLHPDEREGWDSVTRRFDPQLTRELRSVNRATLFAACDAAVGLNSMMLLEAWRAGLPVYSFHIMPTERRDWLSDHHAGVRELADSGELYEMLLTLGGLQIVRTL